MTTPAVTGEGKIWLDGRLYGIEGPVQRELSTRFAPKTVIGDYTDESNPLVSTATWRSWNGGFGLETIRSADDFNRYRASTLYTRLPNHLMLSPRVRELGGGLGTHLNRHFDFGDDLFMINVTGVLRYDEVNDSFITNPVRTLVSGVTDATTGVLNGEAITVIAQGSATDWSNSAGDSTSWQRDSTPMSRVTFWRDLLWGMDSQEQLFFTNDLAAGWTQVATLPEPSAEVVNLFAGPSGDRGDPEALYLATRRGLWVYDNQGERFRSTGLTMPRSNASAAAWNGSVFYTNEQRVFRFTPGPLNVIDDLTPDVLSESSVSGSLLGPYIEAHPGIDGIYFLTGGDPAIHQWDGKAWSSVPADGNGDFASSSTMGGLFLSTASGKHRLIYGHYEPFVANGTVAASLPVLSADLASQSSLGFVSNGRMDTPWFDGFVSGQEKLAVSVGLEVTIPDSAETLRITYSADNGEVTGTVVELNDPGHHAVTIPITDANGEPAGVLFDRISLGVEMSLDVTDSAHVLHSPDVQRLSLNYIKSQPVRWAYSFLITPGAGESGVELRQALENTFNRQTLVEFGFHDPDVRAPAAKRVTPVSLRSEEITGHEEHGKFRVVVTEV